MSWMDGWSRPSKSQATPAPYYLLPGGDATPYCHSCGRVIGARRIQPRTTTASAEQVKYCSARCRSHKPGKRDREIEAAFVRLLNGHRDSEEDGNSKGKGKGTARKDAKNSTKRKGDQRVLVPCSAVEKLLFGHQDSEVSSLDGGSEDQGALEEDGDDELEPHAAGNPENPALTPSPYVDGDVLARMSIRSGTRKRPPQSVSEVNGSVGGEKGRAERIEETAEMREKRLHGQRRAKEREMVRCAARRGVAFGFDVEVDGSAKEKGDSEILRRKCEAVMLGKVVEPSFAKGDWSIRWRE